MSARRDDPLNISPSSTSTTGVNPLSVNSFSKLLSLLLFAVLAFVTSGCREADVAKQKDTFDTDIKITEPAYAMRRAKDPPWYSNIQVLLDEKPVDEKDLESKINDGKAEVKKNTQVLLEEIEAKIGEQRQGRDKWSIIAVSCGRGKKPNEIHLEAEVGLTKLYARRPGIAFNAVPVELCIAKLARESEIQDSQPKGHNPSVTWEKQNVSAFEAINAILTANGFEQKFTDTSYKVSFKAQDFISRKEFVDAVSQSILAKGKTLNSVRPALIVTPAVKEPKPAADTKKPDEAKSTTDVKIPPETKPQK